MDKKIIKDTVINSSIGVLETTGFLSVILIVALPVLAIAGFSKKAFRKLKK